MNINKEKIRNDAYISYNWLIFFFHLMTSVHVLQVISHVSVHAIFLFKVQQAES